MGACGSGVRSLPPNGPGGPAVNPHSKLHVQVPPEHYRDSKYLNPERERSFEIQEALASGPGLMLELGIGSGELAKRLRARRVRVVTADIDPRLRPDVACSITSLPFRDRAFDRVLAFEVLEHVPLDLLPSAVREVCRAAADGVIVSVPEKKDRIKTFISLHILGRKWQDPQHHWELGLFVSTLRFLRLFYASGFGVARYDATHPWHRFFVFIHGGTKPLRARWQILWGGNKLPRRRVSA